MKKINQKMLTLVAIICLLSSAKISYGQFTSNNPCCGDIGYTTNSSPNITGIGIGFFNSTNISAALHVNTNLTAAQSGGFAAGQVFRTEGNP